MERVGDVIEKARRGARGRQDRSGQEKVIDKTHLVDAMPRLVKLHTANKEAGEELSDAIKRTAEKSGAKYSASPPMSSSPGSAWRSGQ